MSPSLSALKDLPPEPPFWLTSLSHRLQVDV